MIRTIDRRHLRAHTAASQWTPPPGVTVVAISPPGGMMRAMIQHENGSRARRAMFLATDSGPTIRGLLNRTADMAAHDSRPNWPGIDRYAERHGIDPAPLRERAFAHHEAGRFPHAATTPDRVPIVMEEGL